MGSPVVVESTRTVCPQCLAAAPARGADADTFIAGELVESDGRILMRRRCPVHGESMSLYEEHADLWHARRGFTPVPRHTSDQPSAAGDDLTAYAAGLPADHGQHTCILLLNLTGACNLTCPTCFADSAPQRDTGEPTVAEMLHTVRAAIDREGGQLDVLMLSGGEPTVRADLPLLLERLAELPITRVMLNTNGLRLARDERLLQAVAAHRRHLEVYLQFDGLRPATHQQLRGVDLCAAKQACLERLGQARLATTLVMSVQRGVNEDELGDVLRLGLSLPHCAGLAVQPVFGSGRGPGLDPLDRVTPTGVLRRFGEQTDGLLGPGEFISLPCGHPDCCDVAYLVRDAKEQWQSVVSLVGREKLPQWLPLLSNTVTFEHLSAPLMGLLREGCAPTGELGRACCGGGLGRLLEGLRRVPRLLPQVSERAFRVTCKMFMDAHTFSEARLRRCCVHSGTYEADPRRYSFCWRWLFADAGERPL